MYTVCMLYNICHKREYEEALEIIKQKIRDGILDLQLQKQANQALAEKEERERQQRWEAEKEKRKQE